MGDLSKETVKDRFWIVISWIQFGCAVVVATAAGLLSLGEYAGVTGRQFFETFASLLLVGFLTLLGLGVVTYIFTGVVRFLPKNHRRTQAVSIFVITVVAGMFLVLSLHIDKVESVEEAEASQLLSEPEYTEKFIMASGLWTLVTHNKTSRKALYQKHGVNNGANLRQIGVAVVDDTLIIEVLWDAQCLPKRSLSANVTCSGRGDSAFTIHYIKPTDWESLSQMNWGFNEGGFSAAANFKEWPLDTLRQHDSIFAASGRTQPDISKITRIRDHLRYESNH